MRIAHITISHAHLDVRIFCKEARTAAAAGHEVHVLAPGTPPAPRDGVVFHELPEGVGMKSALFWEVLRHYPAILRAARAIDADVYQLPDPILIPVALMLRRRGARVVYDAHEDRPQQALTKYRTAGRPVVALVSRRYGGRSRPWAGASSTASWPPPPQSRRSSRRSGR